MEPTRRAPVHRGVRCCPSSCLPHADRLTTAVSVTSAVGPVGWHASSARPRALRAVGSAIVGAAYKRRSAGLGHSYFPQQQCRANPREAKSPGRPSPPVIVKKREKRDIGTLPRWTTGVDQQIVSVFWLA